MSASPKISVLDAWEEMAEQIAQRLAEGDLEYAHDPADKKDTQTLIREIEEEILDVCAWGLFLWQRVGAVKARMAELEKRARRLSQMTPPPYPPTEK